MLKPVNGYVILKAPEVINSDTWNLGQDEDCYEIVDGYDLPKNTRVFVRKLAETDAPYSTYHVDGETYKIVPQDAIIAVLT